MCRYYLRRKQVMFSLRSACLFVCPSDNWKSCERILINFLEGVGHCPGTNGINFGDDPHHRPDPGVRSPKSGFTGLSKNLPTDVDEILRRAGVWSRDQLITFWWRPASLSGSGSPFRITIRIPEELPRLSTHTEHTPSVQPANRVMLATGVRRRSVLSEYF